MTLNRRASAALEQLQGRYAGGQRTATLHEVEAVLARVDKLARRPSARFWPWSGEPCILASGDVDRWIANHPGWSLPCAEALSLISKCRHGPTARVIDVGAGSGLWTRTLKREFGAENVIGLDPEPKSDEIIETTFLAWCEETGGLRNGDVVLLSWPPCTGQPGQELGTEVLDAIGSGHTLVYVGAGPRGPAGTPEFHDRLAREFEEYATEPVPRPTPTIFPRDYARAYQRRRGLDDRSPPGAARSP